MSVLGLIERRGEWVCLRSINRSTNQSTGENLWNYTSNWSCKAMITMWYTDHEGRTVLLPSNRATLWGRPSDFWDVFSIKVNDEIIRFPTNYSAGTSEVYRVDEVKRQPWLNTSQWYIRASLMLTKARD